MISALKKEKQSQRKVNATDRLFLFAMMGMCMFRAVNSAVAPAECTERQTIFANYV